MSDLEAIRQRTEEKRRKLEEIRRKKALREAATKQHAADLVAATAAYKSSTADETADDLLKSIDALVGATTPVSAAAAAAASSTHAPAGSPAASAAGVAGGDARGHSTFFVPPPAPGTAAAGGTATASAAAGRSGPMREIIPSNPNAIVLAVVSPPPPMIVIPPQPRAVTYSQEVQTDLVCPFDMPLVPADPATGAAASGAAASAAAAAAAADDTVDDDLKQRVARFRSLETANAELRQQSRTLQSRLEAASARTDELEAKLRPPSPPPALGATEAAKVIASEGYKTALSKAAKLVERALWTGGAPVSAVGAGMGAGAAGAALLAASMGVTSSAGSSATASAGAGGAGGAAGAAGAAAGSPSAAGSAGISAGLVGSVSSAPMVTDYTADTAVDVAGSRARASAAVATAAVLHAPRLSQRRAVAALAWSRAHAELLACGYEPLNDPLAREPDGLVLVWNRAVPTRPEFELRCESAVTAVAFNPGVARQVVAGTASGQLLVWDFRSPPAPIARSSLAAGHTFPIIALTLVPHVNDEYAAVSVSSDGRVCSWALRDLHAPLATVDIGAAAAASAADAAAAAALAGASPAAAGESVLSAAGVRPEDLALTAADFPSRDTAQAFLAGTEEGAAVLCRLKAESPGAHAAWQALSPGAPVAAVAYHAYDRERGLQADVCLVAGLDWQVHLCAVGAAATAAAEAAAGAGAGAGAGAKGGRARGAAAPAAARAGAGGSEGGKGGRVLLSLQTARDAVTGLAWSPVHPAVFAVGDASGRVDLFNLLEDTEAPVSTIVIKDAGAPAAAAAGAGKGKGKGVTSEEEKEASTAPTAVDGGAALGVSRLSWSLDGSFIAVGTLNGATHILAVPAAAAAAPPRAAERFAAVRHRLAVGTSAAGVSVPQQEVQEQGQVQEQQGAQEQGQGQPEEVGATA